jgi:ferritin
MISPARASKDKLEARLLDEYTAHMFYRTLSNWCEDKGYSKAAAYYAKEAEQELEHAKKLQKFAVDSGVVLRMPTGFPTFTFMSLFDGIDQQYDLEAGLYEKYSVDMREVLTVDAGTFLLMGEMVQIQYDSVAEARTLVDMKKELDPADRLSVFMFEKEAYE